MVKKSGKKSSLSHFRDRETEDHPSDKGYQVNSKAGNRTRLQDPIPAYIPFYASSQVSVLTSPTGHEKEAGLKVIHLSTKLISFIIVRQSKSIYKALFEKTYYTNI